MIYFIYANLWIIGILFGSFYTLAVHRIPKKQDITHERSYCPNCGHKLSFFDLIPVISYLFLKGRCRYCGMKIRIRYLLLELFAGFVFLLYGMVINLEEITIEKIIYLIIGAVVISMIFIFLGIYIEVLYGNRKKIKE